MTEIAEVGLKAPELPAEHPYDTCIIEETAIQIHGEVIGHASHRRITGLIEDGIRRALRETLEARQPDPRVDVLMELIEKASVLLCIVRDAGNLPMPIRDQILHWLDACKALATFKEVPTHD